MGKKKKQKTEIAPDSWALVTDGEGYEILMPDWKGDKAVPPSCLLLMGAFFRLHDDEAWRNELMAWTERKVAEATKDE